MTLTQTLRETPTKELLRAFNTNKEYLFFDISVFNAGAAISIRCTDDWIPINQNTWNGYDFIIENDFTTNEYIETVLVERVKNPRENEPKVSATQLKRINKIIEL